MRNFFKIFSFSKTKNQMNLDTPKNEVQSEIDTLFINKVKDFRYDFCQKMIDDGFVPSKATIDKLQNILWAEISEHSTCDYIRKLVPLNERNLEKDEDDSYKQIILLIKLMNDNSYLDYNFLKKSQDCTNYIDYKKTKKELGKNIIFNSEYKRMAKVCSSFNLNNQVGSIFSSFLYFDSELDSSIIIKSDSNILQDFIKVQSSVDVGSLIDYYKENKKDSKKLKSNKEYLDLILVNLVPNIVLNDIDSEKVKPLDIIKDAFNSNTSFQTLSNLVLTYYPEVIAELSKDDGIEVLRRIKSHIKECKITNKIKSNLLDNYIDKLTDEFHQKREKFELENIHSKNHSEVFQTNDYVEQAKLLNSPKSLIDILVMLKNDISSLKEINLSETDKHTLQGLEKSLLKSLNVYAGLMEIDITNNKKENISNYLEHPVLDMLKVVREIKEVNINEKLSDLMVNKKVIGMKVR